MKPDVQLRRIEELTDSPDPDYVWAWDDGYLHDEPPLPAQHVHKDLVTELNAGRLPWPPWDRVEAPICGAVAMYPGVDAKDHQERRFTCTMAPGHEGEHVAVVDLMGGTSTYWA